MNKTPFYDAFLEYYQRAAYLQEHCNLGTVSYTDETVTRHVNDPLMQQVEIYDCVERRYAGFSNLPQDLWHAGGSPKIHHQPDTQQHTTRSYARLRATWSRETWLYVLLLHRITGSGASFEEDHGYRNSVIPELAKLDTISDMTRFLAGHQEPYFTSIGNQPPQTNNKLFLQEYAPRLVSYVNGFLLHPSGNKPTIREVVDKMNGWNLSKSFKRFSFVYTAFAMDISDYMPELVDPVSEIYYGSNATKCAHILFDKPSRVKPLDFLHQVSMRVMNDTGGYPKDTEDVFCDFVRYLNNYIPDSKLGTYKHLIGSTFNNSGVNRSDLPEWAQKYGA